MLNMEDFQCAGDKNGGPGLPAAAVEICENSV